MPPFSSPPPRTYPDDVLDERELEHPVELDLLVLQDVLRMRVVPILLLLLLLVLMHTRTQLPATLTHLQAPARAVLRHEARERRVDVRADEAHHVVVVQVFDLHAQRAALHSSTPHYARRERSC